MGGKLDDLHTRMEHLCGIPPYVLACARYPRSQSEEGIKALFEKAPALAIA
jgi:hypothetical protein